MRDLVRRYLIFGVFLAMALVAFVIFIRLFEEADPRNGPEDVVIAVVAVPPQAFVVDRIGGSHVHVITILPEGSDPHTYTPTPGQIRQIAEANVIFTLDIPFTQRVVSKLQSPNGPRVTDHTKGIAKRSMEAHHHGPEGGDDHNEHENHAHDHDTGPDPHVWMSPKNLIAMAETVARVLSELDPEHADTFRGNLVAFRESLETLDRDIARRLAPHKGKAFYVFHPAFGYFGDAYGLEQRPVEIEGKQPSPSQIRQLVEKARSDGVTTIFYQKQFDSKSAMVVAAALGGSATSLDPLAADVPENLKSIAEALAASFE